MDPHNYYVLAYAWYLVLTVGITVLVARTLFKNGKVFLIDIFHGNALLATSVNNLLLVGFYLVNLGYAVYTLTTHRDLGNFRDMIELLSTKIGCIILLLGAMHFGNLIIFFKLRRKALAEKPTHLL